MYSLEAVAIPSNGNAIGMVGTKLNSRGKIEAGEVRARAVLEIPGKVARGMGEANAERSLKGSHR